MVQRTGDGVVDLVGDGQSGGRGGTRHGRVPAQGGDQSAGVLRQPPPPVLPGLFDRFEQVVGVPSGRGPATAPALDLGEVEQRVRYRRLVPDVVGPAQFGPPAVVRPVEVDALGHHVQRGPAELDLPGEVLAGQQCPAAVQRLVVDAAPGQERQVRGRDERAPAQFGPGVGAVEQPACGLRAGHPQFEVVVGEPGDAQLYLAGQQWVARGERQRTPQDRDGRLRAVLVERHRGQPQQGVRLFGSGYGPVDRLGQHGPRPRTVPGREQAPRRGHQAPVPSRVGWWRPPAGERPQVGGHAGGAPDVRPPGGLFQDVGDVRIRTVGRERQVTGPLFEIRYHLGQPAVHGPAQFTTGGRVHR